MAITPLGTAPQRTDDPQTFATRADILLGGLPTMVTEINDTISGINTSETNAATSATNAANSAAAAQAAQVASGANANVTAWVSGTTYAVGDVRYSPANFLPYRRRTAGAGTTDPSADTTNWAPAAIAMYPTVAKTAAYTAVANDRGINFTCTNTFTFSLTAATTLGNGWWCMISNTGTGVITIDPNGAELINGASNFALYKNQWIVIGSNGSSIEIFAYGNKTLHKWGTSVASATTLDLTSVEGDSVHVSGTTTINAITLPFGVKKTLVFDSALTITHGSLLNLPFNNNVTTYTGMVLEFIGITGGVRCINSNNVPMPYAQFEYRLASGSSSTEGAFNTATARLLNTTVENSITSASLSTNQITLPAGTYRVSVGQGMYWVSGAVVGQVRTSFYNETDTTHAVLGLNRQFGVDTGSAMNGGNLTADGRFTITTSKVFSVRTASTTANAVPAGPISSGQSEIYRTVQIWKEA